MTQLLQKIEFYQKSIQAHSEDNERLLHCLQRLDSYPVTFEILQKTGVGRTVNSLRKLGNSVGSRAIHLVNKWKKLVDESGRVVEDNDMVQCNQKQSKTSEAFGAEVEPEIEPTKTEVKDERRKKCSSHTDISRRHTKESRSKHRNERSSDHNQQHESSSNKSKYENKSTSNKSSSKVSNDSSNLNDEKPLETSNRNGNQRKHENRKRSSETHNEERNESEKKPLVMKIDLKKGHSSVSSDNQKSRSKTEEHSSRRDEKKSSKHKSKERSHHEHRSKQRSEQNKPHHKRERSETSAESKEAENVNKKYKIDVQEVEECKGREIEKKRSKNFKASGSKVCSTVLQHLKERHLKESKTEMSDVEDDGMSNNTGISFDDAMCSLTKPPKRKSDKIKDSVKLKKTEISVNSKAKAEIDATNIDAALESLDADTYPCIDPTLPTITPFYKPFYKPNHQPTDVRKKKFEDLSQFMYTKSQRTKVFSGNKSGFMTVPSLYDSAVRVLIDNIESIESTGGVPYYLLKPVLENASPEQLFVIENFNPELLEDTGELWEFHCKKEFRNKPREKTESWRDMYLRCYDAREEKLKSITESIKSAQSKACPIRSTKLAYVDHIVKPPRNILRQQAKYGTAGASTSYDIKKKKIISTTGTTDSAKKLQTANSSSSGSGRPVENTFNNSSSTIPKPTVSAKPSFQSRKPAAGKKKVAPLMQKALQLVKYRRCMR